MFPSDLTKAQLLSIVEEMPDKDFARYRYVQEMGATYLAVVHFEDVLIDAMNVCDRVKVRYALGNDADRWETFKGKRTTLQSSTLGSLISILERHKISPDDVHYLRWVKEKRDYFIHRWFYEGGWPGDMDASACHAMTRQLLAIQLWLHRGERNVWAIFERADFVELTRHEDGLLIMNKGLLDMFMEGAP